MNPIHPMLVHLPIGALLTATLLTIFAWRRADMLLARAVPAVLVIGLLGALPAIASGLYDAWRQLTGPEIARSDPRLLISNLHALATLASCAVYWRVWLQQRRRPEEPAAVLRGHLAAAGLLIIGGWLGGRLVYEFGMGGS
jgi:uncharacterized membrane protein